MTLTILQIATRIACIPTAPYVISSYSNVRLQQPSMDSSVPLVKSRMANDLTMNVASNDEPATTEVIDKIENDESEMRKLNNNKFAGIEFLEFSTVVSGSKGKEEELPVAKTQEEVVENVTKSSELMIENNDDITTKEPETTTFIDVQDDNQPTTVETSF